MLTKLDLSRNGLGQLFCASLRSILVACPSLSYLDLSRNPLGASGAAALADVISSATALKTLDLTETNLCNCTPIKALAQRPEWSGEGIAALSLAMVDAAASNLPGTFLETSWNPR